MTEEELSVIETRSIGPWGDFELFARADVRELAREVHQAWLERDEMQRAAGELLKENRWQAERAMKLYADIERISAECSQLREALRFAAFVVDNSLGYLPKATGIERDALKFLKMYDGIFPDEEVTMQ